MVITEDATPSPSIGSARRRNALRAAPSLWPDGYQERRELKASEPLYGTCSNPDDRALHFRSWSDGPGPPGGLPGYLWTWERSVTRREGRGRGYDAACRLAY